jgi:hypothetical protein
MGMNIFIPRNAVYAIFGASLPDLKAKGVLLTPSLVRRQRVTNTIH